MRLSTTPTKATHYKGIKTCLKTALIRARLEQPRLKLPIVKVQLALPRRLVSLVTLQQLRLQEVETREIIVKKTLVL
jgi:hypothetical protein